MLSGISFQGVIEKLTVKRIPPAVVKYFFCCPNLDFNFRCMPSAGGLYDQRMRDFFEFNIIEQRIRDFRRRKNGRGD